MFFVNRGICSNDVYPFYTKTFYQRVIYGRPIHGMLMTITFRGPIVCRPGG